MPFAPDADAAFDEPRTGWRAVAGVTFQHHLRSGWLLPLSLLALTGPLLAVVRTTLVWVEAAAWDVPSSFVLGPLHAALPALLPVFLLLMVVPAYRGAWLRDSSESWARVGGFFAGTLQAVAAALAPWLVLSGLILAVHGHLVASAPFLLADAALALLYAGAWIALLLLVCVGVESAERRILVAASTWGALALALPALHGHVRMVLTYEGNVGPIEGAWTFLLGVLSPVSAYHGARVAAYDGLVSDAFVLTSLLGHWAVGFVLLALWAAIPLAFAAMLQGRGRG